jgi:hypothetical protein
MARHDAARTGAANGTSDIAQPEPVWRLYLGGSLGGSAMQPFDVDGDGSLDLVYLTGGSLVAKRVDDSLIWQTDVLGLEELNAIVDVNGDGTADIVASSNNRAHVFNVRTGAVEWAETAGELGVRAATRVGDLDGDSLPDVFVQECGCCAVSNANTGFAYGFGAGFGAPKKLWTLPSVACGGRNAMALVDVDGDGRLEATLGTGSTIQILDGATGAVKAESPSLGGQVAFANCLPADADGKAGEELFCIQNYSAATPSGHHVYALRYSATPTPSLSLLWQRDVGQQDGAVVPAPELVLDLDGDGTREVVVSGNDLSGQPNTSILDALTGDSLATIPGRVAAAPTFGTKALVMVRAGTATVAYSFTRAGGATTSFSLAGVVPVVGADYRRLARSSINGRSLATDVDGDGVADVIAYRGNPARELVAYALATGAPLASYTAPATDSLQTVWLAQNVTTGFAPIYAARSDGYLFSLNASLVATNADRGGVRIGGYYASGFFRDLNSTPVTAALESGAKQSVLVRTSDSTLLRADASTASNASPPSIVWSRPNTLSAAVVANLDGGKRPGIACRALALPITDPPAYTVVALRADGTSIWEVGHEGVPFGDVVPGRGAGGSTALMFQWGQRNDLLQQLRAVTGSTGTTLWNAPAVNDGAGRQPAGFAVSDWNADGIDDVFLQASGTRVFSGVDGHQLFEGATGEAYFMPIVFDTDGNGSTEITLQGGFSSATTFTHDLTARIWSGNEADRPYPYGAVTRCAAGGSVLVEGALAFPNRLRISQLAGASVGTGKSLWLVGGKSYADEASAKAAGGYIGQLTSATIHSNLGGDGAPIALVGSSDGWLYGVKACTGTLAFSYNFHSPVGEPIYADTDGDGIDEIVVSVGDGYLYGMKNLVLPAPKDVIDISPIDGITDHDVDTTTSTTSLSAKWSAVTGADRYEIAAVDRDGHFLTTPSWKDVGTGTEYTVSGLALSVGQRYAVAVRAVAGGKTSADTPSDGVVVVPAALPDAGPDGGDAAPDASPDAISDGGIDATADATTDAVADASPTNDDGYIAGGSCALQEPPHATSAAAVLGGLCAALLVLDARRRRGRRSSR